jgi:hypothetical protein
VEAVDSKDTEAETVELEPEYMIKMALLQADIVGVSSDEERDEVLSIFSLDDECDGNNEEDEEEWTTVYYPLIPQPK